MLGLSHNPSTAGLDEEKQSMVLELYCRKAGGKREGRKTETGHGHVKRGEKNGGEGELQMRIREVRA